MRHPEPQPSHSSGSVTRWAVPILALFAGGCADDSALLEIPSHFDQPPAARFEAAADSSREAVREVIAARYLPGVSVAVSRGGEIVWAEGFGWADLSHNTPATPETLYPVGSISKSLTATAAGLLHERGLLDFDVPIQRYIPDFPEKRWPVSTRQLLGHTAGIINYGVADALRQVPCEDAAAGLVHFASDTLLHEPGTAYRYSNYGFRLVGAIVEAIAEEPYLDFMDREVFTPMGMERTVPDLGDEGPLEATRYDRGSFDTLRRGQEIDMRCSMAAGGFLSTPSELIRFAHAMQNGEILAPETVRLFWTPQRLASGAATAYGFGWMIANTRLGDDDEANTPMIWHGGSVLGGTAVLRIYPGEDMVVVVMTNASGDVTGLTNRIAAYFRDSG